MRNSPNQLLAPTQNTAPVLKFRCLYTYDLRRKAKRWQDGFLRFHTFNKRAMVYDTTGNFIGDSHWRESEVIQEGDELELDKGVLIQVEECVEKTQSDISSLFEKKKAGPESPSRTDDFPSSSRTPVPRSTASSSQVPLKSLNDVLGIKKTPRGRVTLPQSPYQQLHSRSHAAENSEGERPAKRRKQLPPAGILPRKNSNERLRDRHPIIDLEKAEDDIRPARPMPESVFHAPKGTNTTVARGNPPMPAAKFNDLSERRMESHRISAEGTSPPGFAAKTAKPEHVSTNPLRISSEKPRGKLMYKALLPHNDIAEKLDQLPTSGSPTTPSDRGQRPRSESVSLSQKCQIAADVSSNARTVSFVAPSASEKIKFRQINLPLETLTTVTLEPDSRRTGVSNVNRLSKGSPLPTGATSHRIPSHRVKGSDISQMMTEKAAANGMALQSRTVPGSASNKGPEVVFRFSSDMGMRLRRQLTAIGKTPAPANYDLTATSACESLHEYLSEPMPLETAGGNKSCSVPPGRPPGKLSSNRGKEIEPWTSEALYLFDWWPPGRPKPSCTGKEF
jgi:Protein of unknown function (DUF2439)